MLVTTPLSPRAVELLAELTRHSTVRDRLLGRRPDPQAALRELRTLAEPAVVPYVLPSAFDAGPLAGEAALTLHHLLALVPSRELAALDERCRQLDWYAPWARGWRELRPVDLSRLAGRAEVATSLLALASFHPSGFLREAAVTALDAERDVRVLPFLLLRISDWVAPVAERADAAVRRRLTPGHAEALVAAMPLLLRLSERTRRDVRPLLDGVFALLRDPAQHAALEVGIAQGDRATRRVCFRLLLDDEGDRLLRTVLRAARGDDPMVRLEAAHRLRRLGRAEEVREGAGVLARAPFMPVRRETLTAIVERFGAEATDALERALLDRHRSVRELARYYLGRFGHSGDPAELYRSRLAQAAGPELQVALAGLGETGRPADAALVAAFADDAHPAVRKAALRALAQLDLDGQLSRLVRALTDAHPGVSRVAREALATRARVVGAATLLGLLRSAPHAHSRKNALALAARLAKWESLPILLEASAIAEPALHSAGQLALKRWAARANRTFVAPTAHQLEDIGAALDRVGSSVDARLAADIRAGIAVWAPREDASTGSRGQVR